MHCVDFSQAFIQADWASLPEKAPQFFIRPSAGWDEEPGVVYECLRPLYGHCCRTSPGPAGRCA
eukprot:1305269-Rhodomonas_salina.1